MALTNIDRIIIQEIGDDLGDDAIIVRAETAFRSAANTTWTDDKTTIWKSAIMALFLSYGPGTDEFELIQKELQMLTLVNHMFSTGKPIEVGMMLEDGFEPLGLWPLFEKVWKEKHGDSEGEGTQCPGLQV